MAEIKCNHCGAICDDTIHDGRCLECGRPFCSSPSAGSERTWHDVVVECERIMGCPDTADSPTMSNLPNLIRDLKNGIVPNSVICATHDGGGKDGGT